MGNFSTAINLCDSGILCWLSIAYDFLFYFNTEIKCKTLNMIQCSTSWLPNSAVASCILLLQPRIIPCCTALILTRGNSPETHGSAAVTKLGDAWPTHVTHCSVSKQRKSWRFQTQSTRGITHMIDKMPDRSSGRFSWSTEGTEGFYYPFYSSASLSHLL